MDLNKVSEIIINTLPTDITQAIYLFGSCTTDYFVEDSSDIDIGWFTEEKLDWLDLEDYKEELENKLGVDVDIVNNEYSKLGLTVNILTGKLISETTTSFDKWLDRFNEFYKNEVSFLQSYKEERLYG